MVLHWVTKRALHPGGTTTVQRFFIDMPVVTGKICLIKQAHVFLEDWGNLKSFDVGIAISADPDHAVPATLAAEDSRYFVFQRFARIFETAVGQQQTENNPRVYHYPEGISCPYSRLPFFVQNSNTSGADIDYHITLFFEYTKVSATEMAIATLRRGRATTRRVP